MSPTRPLDRAAKRGGFALGRASPSVGLLVVALFLIPVACSSETTTSASRADSRFALVIGAHSMAGLPIGPDTSYQQALRHFTRAGLRGSSSFPEGFCRLRFAKLGLFATFRTLADGAGTPAKCTFFGDAVVTGPRWHTANGLRVGATAASLRRLFPRAFNSGRIPGKRWGIPTGSTRWELADGASSSHAARPILVAYVRAGRVAALGINIAGR